MAFELIITPDEIRRSTQYVTIWENDNGVTRISLESQNPSDTESEYVGKATPIVKFAALHFGGLGNPRTGEWPAIKVTFDESGAFKTAETV
jgi:hypothetical protein